MKIIIRVDANSTIGNGHLMRCLTLATALKANEHDITFICLEENRKQITSLVNNDFSIIFFNIERDKSHNNNSFEQQDALGCIKATQPLNVFDLCIVDHYSLAKSWQLLMLRQSKKIMVIDDLANRKHYADILLDQSLNRPDTDYQKFVPKHCILLTGSEHALLRPEFSAVRKKAIQRHFSTTKIESILVSIGGTDPLNVTEKVIKALISLQQAIPTLFANIVLASNAANKVTIQKHCQKHSWMNLLIDSPNIAKLIHSADIAIGASGSTAWERCCLGLPTLSVITASNQEFIAKTLENENAQINLGFAEALTPEYIHEQLILLASDNKHYVSMVKSSSEICDGLGVNRVIKAINDAFKDQTSLILATAGDCSVVFEWQSNPELRKFSRNPKAIKWQEHQAWFTTTLKSKTKTLFIIKHNDIPCGVLRLDIINSTTQEISILLSASHHGKNIASNAIKSIPLDYKKRDIMANVHPKNVASHKLFTRAGFNKIAIDQYILPATV